MAGFRNILVHGYDTVDLAIVRDVVEHRLDDLSTQCACQASALFKKRILHC